MTSYWTHPLKLLWVSGLLWLILFERRPFTFEWEIGCCKGMRNLERKVAITDTNGAGVDVGPTESSKEAPKAMVIPWSSPPFTDHLFKPCSTALSDVGHHLDPGQPLLPALSTVQTQASNTLPGERWSSPPGIQSAILRSGCPVAITHPTAPATNQAGCTACINTRWLCEWS